MIDAADSLAGLSGVAQCLFVCVSPERERQSEIRRPVEMRGGSEGLLAHVEAGQVTLRAGG